MVADKENLLLPVFYTDNQKNYRTKTIYKYLNMYLDNGWNITTFI
jgi:hypothetical protein